MKNLFKKRFSPSVTGAFFVLSILVLFAGILKGENANKATDCSYQICLINGNGTPLANHDYVIYYNGVKVASGTTNLSGCTTVTLADGKTYLFCDQSTPCLHNCVEFTVSCSTPGQTLTICSP